MIIKGLLTLTLVVACWIGVLAGVMYATDAAPAALVLMPSEEFLAALPEEVAILSRNSFSITLGADSGLDTARLYDAGALVVLPAGLMGCAPLTS